MSNIDKCLNSNDEKYNFSGNSDSYDDDEKNDNLYREFIILLEEAIKVEEFDTPNEHLNAPLINLVKYVQSKRFSLQFPFTNSIFSKNFSRCITYAIQNNKYQCVKFLLQQEFIVKCISEDSEKSETFQKCINESLYKDNETRMSILLLSNLSENPNIMLHFKEEEWTRGINNLLEFSKSDSYTAALSKLLKLKDIYNELQKLKKFRKK